MIDADSLEQVKGFCVYPLVAEEHREAFKEMTEAVFRGESRSLEFKVIGLKGRPVWLYSHAVPLRNERGEIFSLLSATMDITERKTAEEERNRSLREKEVLLREIHHRVKNNLAVISSLLQLQAHYVADENVRRILDESRNRIRSMALVHEKLYDSKDLTKVDIKGYILGIAGNLFDSYAVDKKRITLETDIEDIPLNIDQLIPCGLVINELVTNSIKYAFKDKGKGLIKISFRAAGPGRVSLGVSDDGSGLPLEEADIFQAKTLGLRLVASLVKQLKGEVRYDGTEGASYSITFETQ